MTILFAVPACPLWGKEFQPSHHLAYRSFCYLDSLEIHLVSRVITVGARADQANLMEFTYPLFDQCCTCTSSSCLYGFGCASWSRGLLPLVTSSEGRLSPETIHNRSQTPLIGSFNFDVSDYAMLFRTTVLGSKVMNFYGFFFIPLTLLSSVLLLYLSFIVFPSRLSPDVTVNPLDF